MQKLQAISSAFGAGGVGVPRRVLRRLGDESGIALVMALGIMLVLAIALTTTIILTSSSARHANSSNAGQKAFSLAEAGVNNAISVLHASYDVTPPPTFPGDSSLLTTPRTNTYDTGSVTWSGSLVQTSTGTQWPYEWRITSTGTVANPTGPGMSDVTRKQTAVVPVIISKKEDAGGASVLNWLYASQDLTFLQSVNIATPVYATRDLILGSTATITAAAKSVAVGRNLTLVNPKNKIGDSTARVPAVYVWGSCTYKNQPTHMPCQWDTDNVFAAGPGVNQGGTTIPPDLIDIDPVQAGTQLPTLSCCTLPTPLDPVGSQMGFWYRFSSPGPYFPCATSSGTVPVFDTNTTLDNSAGGASAQNLTPNTPYSCTTPGGSISWDPSANKLKVDGTVYIDGSAYISTRSGTYSGVGTIVLSGTFAMDNQTQMCANATCDSTSWDPNATALVVVANGDGAAGGAQAQVTSGDSVDIKKGVFQGALIANKNIDASVTGTKVIGPMISVNASVSAGQGSDASYPPIHFAPAGTGGITSPPPPGMLLTPRNYAGG